MFEHLHHCQDPFPPVCFFLNVCRSNFFLSFQILSYPLWNHTEGLEEDGSFFFWHGRDQRAQSEHHNTMLSRTLDKFLNLLQKTDKKSENKKPKLNNVHVTCITQYCKLDKEQRKSMFSLCIHTTS